MTLPNESQPNPQSFQDPLENYEPKSYKDPLEQALMEEPATAIQSTPYVSVSPETPIHDAVQQLASLHVACLLIESDRQLVGIFTDRDVLDRVALEYEELKDHPVSEVMTKNPTFIYETDSSAAVLWVMAVSGYRHAPVLDLDKNILGIASPQRVTAFLRKHFGDN